MLRKILLCTIVSVLLILNAPVSAYETIINKCQNNKIVLIVCIGKGGVSYGHGFIIAKNKVVTATHVLVGNFDYVIVGIDGYPMPIGSKQVDVLTNSISVININTMNIMPYNRGYATTKENVVARSCDDYSLGTITGKNNEFFLSDTFVAKGWSGSPVLNSNNEVIGIVEALMDYNRDGNFAGTSVITRIDKQSGVKF